MHSSCNNYLATMPEITVYMNCDTRLAINLSVFDLGDNDEFIFAIKNYDYIDSGYVYLFRARTSDIDKNGEIIFKIPPKASKRLKPGAFYNFSVLANAYDRKVPTEYKKLTDNGKIFIEYGAQDVMVSQGAGLAGLELTDDIVGARLVPEDTQLKPIDNPSVGAFIGGKLVALEEA
mgnify:CR=1 FL=1